MNVKLLTAIVGTLLFAGCSKHDQGPSREAISTPDSAVSLANGTRCIRLPAPLSAELLNAAKEHTRIDALQKAAESRDEVLAEEVKKLYGKKGYFITVTEDKQSVVMERCIDPSVAPNYSYFSITSEQRWCVKERR